MQTSGKKVRLSIKSVGKVKMNKPAYYGNSCYGMRVKAFMKTMEYIVSSIYKE